MAPRQHQFRIRVVYFQQAKPVYLSAASQYTYFQAE